MNPSCRLATLCVGLVATYACEPADTGPTLDVTAKLTSSSCGAAVDAEPSGEFQVQVTQSGDVIDWYAVDTGNAIRGSVDEDGEFTLGEVATLQVTEGSVLDPGCAVRRHDSYSGTLTVVDDVVTEFEAEMVSEYTQATGYSCDALIGAEGGFSDLPCEVAYDLVGKARD